MSNQVLDYVNQLCEAIKDQYKDENLKYHNGQIQHGIDVEHHNGRIRKYESGQLGLNVETTIGKKYIKVIAGTYGVHCFVDKNTGEVYKPATFNAPAKHVRYRLLDESSRKECLSRADWAGGYLYLK